jgi:beta-glucosidase-like glycosyl hydrolase
VRAGVSAVMCSYNRINGTYACENSKSLNGLLKEELGFQGYVMSDWGMFNVLELLKHILEKRAESSAPSL